MNDYKTNGCDGLSLEGYSKIDSQLHVYDWLSDIPGNLTETDFVEVQFKNTRKGYYLNSNHLELSKGDVVAVEASPGHDIGTVTLTGSLVLLQMKKANLRDDAPVRRVYRKARPVDMEKFEEAKAREHKTMIESRQIAKDLGLQMKIGDVEYQGDGGKAIFYYIADGRVDFRQLIKVLAEAFHVRIEMKQIGARQEAGRIGGFGPCGRELCCASWMSSFVSVSTGAARCQDLALNPQKLAGQCAKLKCCMNFEVDTYVEALRRFPARDVTLETAEGTWYHFKSDILAGLVTYSSDKNMAANLTTISTRRAFDIIRLNKEGQKPEALDADAAPADPTAGDLLQDSLTRFDRSGRKKKKNRNRGDRPRGGQDASAKMAKQGGDGRQGESKQGGEDKPGIESRQGSEAKQSAEGKPGNEGRQNNEGRQGNGGPKGDRRRDNRNRDNKPRDGRGGEGKPRNNQGGNNQGGDNKPRNNPSGNNQGGDNRPRDNKPQAPQNPDNKPKTE